MTRHLRRHPAKAAPEAEAAAQGGLPREPAPGVVAMTVEELHLACKQDASGTSERLDGAVLQITGTVGRIVDSEAVGNPCVILASPDNRLARNVLCVFHKQDADQVGRLVLGQQATVQGTFDSCTISVLVTDCTLVQE